MLVYDVMFDVVLLGDTANTSLTEDSIGGGATVSKRRWCVLGV